MPSINYIQFEALLRDLQMNGEITPTGAHHLRNLVAGERSVSKRLSDPELKALAYLVWDAQGTLNPALSEAVDLVGDEAEARGYDDWTQWVDDYLKGKNK